MDKSIECRLLQKMLMIRFFEESLLSLFNTGKLSGTTHSCVGQEASAVAVTDALDSDDYVFSNHRGHGHFISYGGPPELLLKEIMGSKQGVCGGRGGSQHINYRKFFSNGITGGMTPVATGVAMSIRLRKENAISVVFIGEGALGQGVVYESMNMASLWNLPVLYALEDNKYAMSTPVKQGLAGSFEGRAKAFGIDYYKFETRDVVLLRDSMLKVIDKIRSESRPAFVVFDTYRYDGHSKSDKCVYRSREEEEHWIHNDAIAYLMSQMDASLAETVEKDCRDKMNAIFKFVVEGEGSVKTGST